MKTNKELNTEYDRRQTEKIRPKQPEWNWEPLDAVIRKWIQAGAK